MKILKLNVLIAALAFSSYASFGEEPAKPAYATYGFQRENADIRQDISAIQADKERIASLKAQLKNNATANKDMAVVASRKQLAKARADLMRDRRYLCADKKDLRRDHRLAIKERKNEIARDRRDLATYKLKMNEAIDRGDREAASRYASLCVQKQQEISYDQLAYNSAKQNKSDNLAAVKQDIREANARVVNVNLFSRTKNENLAVNTK